MKTYQGYSNRKQSVTLYEDYLVELMEFDFNASEQKVFLWLLFNPGVSTIKQIADGVGRSVQLVSKAMTRLKSHRIVNKVDGRYYVSPVISWPSSGTSDEMRYNIAERIGIPSVRNVTLERQKEKFIRSVEEGFVGEEIHTAWACEPPF